MKLPLTRSRKNFEKGVFAINLILTKNFIIKHSHSFGERFTKQQWEKEIAGMF